jgi:hypothetical protein
MLIGLLNIVIEDSKQLVFRDTYLDRLKTFVPAGDNPAYPDVLVALRVLQQSLQRSQSMLDAESGKQYKVFIQVQTVLTALQVAQGREAVS